MFHYNICTTADKAIFSKQCKALENNIPNLTKKDLLVDVDGSLLQSYTFQNGDEIQVINDMSFGIGIKSTIDTEKYFTR